MNKKEIWLLILFLNIFIMSCKKSSSSSPDSQSISKSTVIPTSENNTKNNQAVTSDVDTKNCIIKETIDMPERCSAQADAYRQEQGSILSQKISQMRLSGLETAGFASTQRSLISAGAISVQNTCYVNAGSPTFKTPICSSPVVANSTSVTLPSTTFTNTPKAQASTATPVVNITPVIEIIPNNSITTTPLLPTTSVNIPVIIPATSITPTIPAIPINNELSENYSIYTSMTAIPKAMWIRDGKINIITNFSQKIKLYEYNIKNKATNFIDYQGYLSSVASDSIISVSCIEVPMNNPSFTSTATNAQVGYFSISGFQQIVSYTNAWCGAVSVKNGNISYFIYSGAGSNINPQSDRYGNYLHQLTFDPLANTFDKKQLAYSTNSGKLLGEYNLNSDITVTSGQVTKDNTALMSLMYNGKLITDPIIYAITGSDTNLYFLGTTTQNLFGQKSSLNSEVFVTAFDKNGLFIWGKQFPIDANTTQADFLTFFNDSIYFHTRNTTTGENIVTQYRPSKL